MPRDIRRVITGHDDDGKAVIMIDETITPDIGHVLPPPPPGGQNNVKLSDIWLSRTIPDDNSGDSDTVEDRVTL